MAGVEKHQSSGAAIRKMMFNVARKERFFKRISGKKRNFRLKCHFFPLQNGNESIFRGLFSWITPKKTAFSG